MEFKATQIDTANISITASILSDDIEKSLEKIAKELSKTANLPGFRKGKVPVKAVKQHYGSRLVEDAEAETLREVLDKGLGELKVDNSKIITEPTFSKFDRTENGIDVVVEVSLRPTVVVEEYASLIPEIEKPSISDEDVNNRINDMLTSKAPFVEVERAVESGDSVTFDFEGFVDGEPFEGGKAENYTLKIGSGSFIPGFEDQIIGLNKGDEKDIEVTFPEEYQSKQLAGKPATFKCKINKIEIKEAPELNEESAKNLLNDDQIVDGENAVETLKRVVKGDLEDETLSSKYNDEIKPALREALAENFSFDLPLSVVEKEIEQRVNQEAQTMSEDEIKAVQESEDKLNELKDKHRSDAEKSVRTTFIIDALSLKEGVSVSDDEVQQVIFYEAIMSQQDPSGLVKRYEEAGLLPLIKMSILEDKVLTKILDDKFKK